MSPRFHRLHHAIGIGHESVAMRPVRSPSKGMAERYVQAEPIQKPVTVLGGCNFGVLLPWWDILFRTANFELRYDPTGVRDQVQPGPDGRVRNYGRGFWAQQWRGVLRLLGKA